MMMELVRVVKRKKASHDGLLQIEKHCPPTQFRVQGAGCRVQGAGCRVQGAGCRVQGSGCRVQGRARRGACVTAT